MKVGILGSGDVAQALAIGFLADGDRVMLASREPAKLAPFVRAHPDATAGRVDEAARFGELLVLPVTGSAAVSVVRSIPAADLAGKVVIDTTLPNTDEVVDGVIGWSTTFDESLLERLQKTAPAARFVKAFTSVGAAQMVRPRYEGGPPTMFVCGDDPVARGTVRDLAIRWGWDVADMGVARAARFVEPLAGLWCIPFINEGRSTQTFRWLTKVRDE